MLVTVLDTRELAVSDRFAAFNEAAGASVAPTANRSDHEDDFRAAVQVADLHTAQLSTLVIPSVQARRTPALIRRGDPETYHVALVTGGRHCLDQAGRQVSAGKGDLLLYDTSQPYTIHTHDDEPAACIIVQVPRTALGLRSRQVDPILAVPLTGTAGIGGLLAQFLTGVVSTADALRPSDAPNLATVLTDLVAALAAHELELSPSALPPPPRQALFLRIRADWALHLAGVI
jgi:AraC-binding-like domain